MNIECSDTERLQKEIDFCYTHLTEKRKQRIQEVLAQRTRHVTIVLENTYHSLNASAIVRTAEIFGLQDIHVIEEKVPFKAQVQVSRGAVHWMSIHRYESSHVCIDTLKQKGYRIVATSVNAQSTPLDTLVVDTKTAFVLGNELEGVSAAVLKAADAVVHLPMYGFTQSFNVSVTAALCLQHAMQLLKDSSLSWQLSPEERLLLEHEWCKRLLIRR